MLKIVGGEYRSRVLHAPRDAAVSRPYAARVKESVFNLLRGWFEGAMVVDLFAGVGTMGLEAISRGVARAVLVERDAAMFKLLKRNIEELGCGDRAAAVQADALGTAWHGQIDRPVDVMFVDPPYAHLEEESSRRRIMQSISRCRPLMRSRSFIVLRSPLGSDDAEWSMEGFAGPEAHSYGHDMHVLLYSPDATEVGAAPARERSVTRDGAADAGGAADASIASPS